MLSRSFVRLQSQFFGIVISKVTLFESITTKSELLKKLKNSDCNTTIYQQHNSSVQT